MNNKKYEVVLFDMDGTLIDHFESIYESFKYTFQAYNQEPLSFQETKDLVGRGLEVEMIELFGKENLQKSLDLFFEKYNQIWQDTVSILPGALWILKNLQAAGYRTAIFTNKNAKQARDLTAHLGFDPHLERTIGFGDTPNPIVKPHPDFSNFVLQQLGISPHQACLIGDSPYDISAGANVGMDVYAIPTGTHSKEELLSHSHKPTQVLKDLYDVGQTIFNLQPEDAPTLTHA